MKMYSKIFGKIIAFIIIFAVVMSVPSGAMKVHAADVSGNDNTPVTIGASSGGFNA